MTHNVVFLGGIKFHRSNRRSLANIMSLMIIVAAVSSVCARANIFTEDMKIFL